MMSEDPQEDPLDFDFDRLLAEGLTLDEARAVLRGSSCCTAQEAADRLEMLRRQREEGRPV
jgi:hypothetical protein